MSCYTITHLMLALVTSNVNIPITASSYAHVVSLPMDTNMASDTVIPSDMPRTESLGFSHRCTESCPIQLPSKQFANAIVRSGQTFHNASDFRNGVYLI